MTRSEGHERGPEASVPGPRPRDGYGSGDQAQDPWVLVGEETPAFDDHRWELYDITTDWSQARDLSKEQPDKLHELQRLWLIEAVKYNVLPLDDRVSERLNPDLAGRPVLIRGNSQLLFGGMGRLSETLGDHHQEQVACGHRRAGRPRRRGSKG